VVSSFDGENHLTRVQSYVGTSRYTQGADSLRKSKLEPAGVLTTLVWDGGDYLGEY
jgi:hypothetical protein